MRLKNNLDVAKQLGLVYDTDNGLQSSFKQRLIIPIFDSKNRCVGFCARLIDEQKDKNLPKYLNSRESIIYKKSRYYIDLMSLERK